MVYKTFRKWLSMVWWIGLEWFGNGKPFIVLMVEATFRIASSYLLCASLMSQATEHTFEGLF